MPENIASRRNLRGICFTTLAFALFSFNDIAGKTLMDNYSPFTVSFWVAGFGVLTLLLASPYFGGLKSCFRTRNFKWHLARGALTAFAPFLVLYALQTIDLVHFYTIVFLAPFITAALAALIFKERVPRYRWLIIAAGFISVLIGIRPDIHGFGLAELAVVTLAIFFALRNLIVIQMGSGESLISYGLIPYFGILLASLIGTLHDLSVPAPMDLTLMAMMGITGALGFISLSYGFRIADASAVAPTHYSQMIWGAVFGYLIFSDLPDFWGAIGAVLVCIFGIWLVLAEHKASKIKIY